MCSMLVRFLNVKQENRIGEHLLKIVLSEMLDTKPCFMITMIQFLWIMTPSIRHALQQHHLSNKVTFPNADDPYACV